MPLFYDSDQLLQFLVNLFLYSILVLVFSDIIIGLSSALPSNLLARLTVGPNAVN